jgi:Tfp pilus assembly protein FimT
MTDSELFDRADAAIVEYNTNGGNLRFAIAAAIRQAERDALERAAQAAEQEAHDAGRVFGEWHDGALAAADRIRALAVDKELSK